MKRFIKPFVITLFIIMMALQAGIAEEQFSISFYSDRSVFSPGENINVNISGQFRSASKKEITKNIKLEMFKISEKEAEKSLNFALLKNPLTAQDLTLKFPYNNYEWFNANEKVKFKGLPSGYYALRATCEQKEFYYLVIVTRLGLIVKTDKEKLIVFAQDTKTGAPVPGADIILVNPQKKKNYKFKTGENGMLKVLFADLSGFKAQNSFVVKASKGQDRAVSGAYNMNIQPELKGYIYTDRPVYRPDQKVYVKGILRYLKDGVYSFKAGEKITLTVKDPKDNEIKKEELETDKFGCFDTSLILTENAALGYYSIMTTSPQGTSYGNFTVEEYRKPEFEITVKPAKEYYVQGDSIKADVEAKYYFGEAVAKTDFTYEVMRSSYLPYDRYNYWWESDEATDNDMYGESGELRTGRAEPEPSYYADTVANGSGKTDDDGKAVISFDTKKWDYDAVYYIKVKMVDKSRREVTGGASAKVTRGSFYLRTETDKYFYATGDTVKLSLKSFTYTKSPVSVPVTVKIIRTIYKNDKSVDKQVFEKQITTNKAGQAALEYKPDAAGYYKIKAESGDENGSSINCESYFYCSSGDIASSWYNFSSADVIADKTYYSAGDKAKLLLAVPHAGAVVLVSVEGEKIHQCEALPFKGNSRMMELQIEQAYTPNVYINLSYFKDGQFYTTTKRLIIPAKENFLTLKIKTDKEKYKPRETAKISISTTDYMNKPVSTQITMGVADESIYAVKPDSTPNMQKFFYGLKYNKVYTTNSFYSRASRNDRLKDSAGAPADAEAPEPEGSMHYYKGKSESKSGEMVQPDFVREFFPDTCYFNPNIITDQNGTASVSVVLPDSLTTWRATARGITTDSKVCEGTYEFIVGKDLLVRLITPRFLTERDELFITGIVHNYLAEDKRAVMELIAKGVKMMTDSKNTYTVNSKSQKRVDWQVIANNAGKADFLLKSLTDEQSDAIKLVIPVIPHGTSKFEAKAGETDSKEEVEFYLPQSATQQTAQLKIQVSPSIAGTMFGSLKYLAGYPYGCTEQTMSRFLPTVVVAKAFKQFDVYEPALSKELPKMAAKGLERLYNFHHSDGGWGWWENDPSNPHMTAYVVYGLSKAKEAGFQIDETKLEAAKNWLKNNYPKQKDPAEQIYMLYALTCAGERLPDWAIEQYGERNSLDNYSCALLAMILQINGETEKAQEMISILENMAEDAGTFCTWKAKDNSFTWNDNQVEITAYALQAFLMIKPESPMTAKAMRYLAFSRTGDRWYSTKDTAAAVLALTEYLKNTTELNPDYTGKITLNGTEIKQFEFSESAKKDRAFSMKISSGKILPGKNTISFEKAGKGTLYYTVHLVYYTKEENIKAQSSGFIVKREYFLVNRKVSEDDKQRLIPLTGDTIRVKSQDLIQVKLTITGSRNYDYAIIEDPKPAGCEVADKIEGGYGDWNYWFAQREVRDQKVAFFITHYTKGTNTLTYSLRAETPGKFHVMPTKASLMYIPEIGGISDETIMIIEDRDMAKKGSVSGRMRPPGFWDEMIGFFH
ncbi:MAG: MG2 domain-containing protein [Firmicutes bacterium]|nr:MG2 domain-containing protein [Bacillota bacterium]